jgi:hypothetical protein
MKTNDNSIYGKLISRANLPTGNIQEIYRVPIIAGMRFQNATGQTDMNKMRKVGHYDFEITLSREGLTVSEKKLDNVFYDKL